MGPNELALMGALAVAACGFSGLAALSVAKCFRIGRRHSTKLLIVGVSLGLLLMPIGMVTVGTLGGGYWEVFGLPGGPLVGIVLAVGIACALASALLTCFALGVWTSAVWVAQRCSPMAKTR